MPNRRCAHSIFTIQGALPPGLTALTFAIRYAARVSSSSESLPVPELQYVASSSSYSTPSSSTNNRLCIRLQPLARVFRIRATMSLAELAELCLDCAILGCRDGGVRSESGQGSSHRGSLTACLTHVTLGRTHPYRPRTSAKMRMRTMPTKILDWRMKERTPCRVSMCIVCAVAKPTASPTMPIAYPAARPDRPTERPAAMCMNPAYRE